MSKIDLKKIIEEQNLDVKVIATELFPGNKYPKLALDRVLKGDAFLDSNQISRLSLMTEIPIQFLYDSGSWTKKMTKDLITFESGEYRAELNTSSNITKVFHKGSLFHESVIHKNSITLSEYLSEVKKLILKTK